MDFLAKKNSHEKDKYITMDNYHKYIISCDPISYKSVTTFVNSFFPKFDKNKIVGMMLKKKYNENDKYYNKTKEDIFKMWDDAAQLGTNLHMSIEKYFNNCPVDDNSLEYTYFLNFVKDYEILPFRTEWRIWDEDSKIAGSLDFLCTVKGEFILCDWKRVTDLDEENKYRKFAQIGEEILPDTKHMHYTLQLNVYAHILRKKYGINIDKLLLIILHPDNNNYVLYPLPCKKELISYVLNN